MLHSRYPMNELDRRPNCHRHNCRASLRPATNWPLVPERMDMPMDHFMDDILAPVNDFMSRVIEPEYRALNNMSNLALPPAGLSDERTDVVLTPNKFQINLNVEGFKPEELAVKTTGNIITMEGKHNEKTDHSQISRSFSRKWTIPEGVKVGELNCHLNARDGILQLEAPRIPPRYKRLEHTYMIPIMVENENEKKRSGSPSSTDVQYDQAELDKNAEILAKETERMKE